MANLEKKKPEWLRVKYNVKEVEKVADLMDSLALNTVCKEANCPNLGECYANGTTTFMILGSKCTRNCTFCNVEHGSPENVSESEPVKVAEAVKKLGLRYVVITSVTRDDLKDDGATQFARTVEEIRKLSSTTKVEVLIPDMKMNKDNLDIVIASHPNVINHNLETVPRLYKAVRPQAVYKRSLEVLKYVKEQDPTIITKTGIMVGLGETREEVVELMKDVVAYDCDMLTIGQYLQPSDEHYPLQEFVTPETFEYYKKVGRELGIKQVVSGPLVRSSYNASLAFEAMEQ